jgi:hypothetical protein
LRKARRTGTDYPAKTDPPGPIHQDRRIAGRSREMLSDERVAILFDIGQSASLADDKHAELKGLIADGYIRKNGDAYELTAKGEKELEDRGAGLNEA